MELSPLLASILGLIFVACSATVGGWLGRKLADYLLKKDD